MIYDIHILRTPLPHTPTFVQFAAFCRQPNKQEKKRASGLLEPVVLKGAFGSWMTVFQTNCACREHLLATYFSSEITYSMLYCVCPCKSVPLFSVKRHQPSHRSRIWRQISSLSHHHHPIHTRSHISVRLLYFILYTLFSGGGTNVFAMRPSIVVLSVSFTIRMDLQRGLSTIWINWLMLKCKILYNKFIFLLIPRQQHSQ